MLASEIPGEGSVPCSEWVEELEAARRCIMRYEQKRDKPLTADEAISPCRALGIIESIICSERRRSSTAEVSDRRAHATEIKQDANGGSLH
jgi:hypothetical protein